MPRTADIAWVEGRFSHRNGTTYIFIYVNLNRACCRGKSDGIALTGRSRHPCWLCRRKSSFHRQCPILLHPPVAYPQKGAVVGNRLIGCY
jgi:hypothetical protein